MKGKCGRKKSNFRESAFASFRDLDFTSEAIKNTAFIGINSKNDKLNFPEFSTLSGFSAIVSAVLANGEFGKNKRLEPNFNFKFSASL